MIYIIYVLIGAVSGVLGGLLGIGGGIITVPCFLYLFRAQEVPDTEVMHMAVATSLAAMIFNTLASTASHHHRGHVLWTLFRRTLPGVVVGSCIGVVMATFLSTALLECIFGLFLCALAVRFFCQKAVVSGSHQLPSPLIFNGLFGGIGMIANLLGIGGGSMAVPLLCSFKVLDKQAIGTSAAITAVTTSLGTLSYMILGYKEMSSSLWGLVNLPAFLIVGATAACFAPWGVKLIVWISAQKVRRLFAFVLAITGILMLLRI